MEQRQYTHLSPEQVENFLKRGFLVVHDCFPVATAERLKARAFDRLGYDAADSSTWVEGRIHMPGLERFEIRDFAPRAWEAICEVCGGEDRIKQPATWADSFIVNFHSGVDRPWQPPSAMSPGWHKDGDWFRHFLDSPEQGLLVIVVWSDIESRGGATFGAGDSIAPVAKFLAQRPEGIRPEEFKFGEMIRQCHDFLEFTGRTGDVILLHPYMLHASSQNLLGIPRFITNPAVSLLDPMRFDRANPTDYSLVERAVLQALGVERFPFRITGERERIVPERERRQKKMLEEEKARLAALPAA